MGFELGNVFKCIQCGLGRSRYKIGDWLERVFKVWSRGNESLKQSGGIGNNNF